MLDDPSIPRKLVCREAVRLQPDDLDLVPVGEIDAKLQAIIKERVGKPESYKNFYLEVESDIDSYPFLVLVGIREETDGEYLRRCRRVRGARKAARTRKQKKEAKAAQS